MKAYIEWNNGEEDSVITVEDGESVHEIACTPRPWTFFNKNGKRLLKSESYDSDIYE